MTLEDFKEIHADDSPIRKLDLLLETMGNWRNDAVNRTDAKWRRNDEEVSYWDNEVKHMMNRSFWLYSELSNMLALQEPRLLTSKDFYNSPIADAGGAIPCWKEAKSPTRRSGWAVIVYGKMLADKDVARYWTSKPTDAQREATPWPN